MVEKQEECAVRALRFIFLMGDFPGGPVVKILRFHSRGSGFDPWSGN